MLSLEHRLRIIYLRAHATCYAQANAFTVITRTHQRTRKSTQKGKSASFPLSGGRKKRSRPENPHKPRVRRIITTQLLARAHFRAIDPARPSNTCDALRRRRRPAFSFLSKILSTTHVRHSRSASGFPSSSVAFLADDIRDISGNAISLERRVRRLSRTNAFAGGVHASASLFLICVTGTTASTCTRTHVRAAYVLPRPSLSHSLSARFRYAGRRALGMPSRTPSMTLETVRCFTLPRVMEDRSRSRGHLEVLIPRMQP